MTVVSLLVTLACLAFLWSLVFSKTSLGPPLRRVALTCVVLAFAPALLWSLLQNMFSASWSTLETGNVIAVLLALPFISLLAYGILKLRRHLAPKSRDAWADYIDRKATGKKLLAARETGSEDAADPLDRIARP